MNVALPLRWMSGAAIQLGLLTLFLLAGADVETCFGQKKERDLRLEKEPPKPAASTADVSAPTAVKVPRSYAVVIGIAQYQNLEPKHQLQYSANDADAIYSILISPEGGNFRAENVRKLIGKQATLENIRRELEVWLPSMALEDDRVLIYFAGHGFVFQGKGYLAPYDISLKNIAGTGYPMDSLGMVVGSRIKAKNKVLLTDACHSGAITPGAQNENLSSSLLNIHKSLFSLTASRDREQSFESPDWGGGHGIFTYYVVKGLEREADENTDGIVTADELAEYVRRNVREATNARQNPTADRGSFDPNLPLSYNPKILASRGGAQRRSDFGTLILVSNMDGVEVFVNGASVGVVNKAAPLKLPGLRPGLHTVKAVRMGYEPDGPREEMVYPDQETTINIKILIPRRRNKAAVDLFDKGMDLYEKGYAENYRKAVEQFEKALKLDATYSQAALYLARTYNALYEQDKAEQYFRQAIQIDADYAEARASFAGMLLDTGNVDEAIRQLNTVAGRQPDDAMSNYLLAQAYRMKDLYPQSIDAAGKAIQLMPKNAEAHFWLAESLRMSKKYEQARTEYLDYLRLSDFDSKLAGKMNYYVLGFLAGLGKKKRAAQQDIWKDLRSLAYFGVGDCERLLSNPDAAIDYYLKSLSLDPEDPLVHYASGLAYYRKAEITQSAATLPEARRHFEVMLKLNSDLAQAQTAKKYLAAINATLASR
ncbi:MAG TPA: tetratricopeptide repeat protein [Terriglobia bacterium]|nr:tetratricopeptide repeat protein [Terriglobia bacterium]